MVGKLAALTWGRVRKEGQVHSVWGQSLEIGQSLRAIATGSSWGIAGGPN